MASSIRIWLAWIEEQFSEELENTKTRSWQIIGIIAGGCLTYGINMDEPLIAQTAFWFGVPIIVLIYLAYLWEFGILKVLREIRTASE